MVGFLCKLEIIYIFACKKNKSYGRDKSCEPRPSAAAGLCHTAECRYGPACQYEAQVRPRSGLALKHGITVLNTPGTIDADYRGEVGVLLINLSGEDFIVNDGERIAQMVIARHEQGSFTVVEELDETERGAGGYGHTGVK